MNGRTRTAAVCIACITAALLPLSAQETLGEKLLQIDNLWVKKIKTADHFSEAYELRLEQPLDHENTGGQVFRQRIYISHAGFSRPVLLETEGYTAPANRTKELCGLLKCNQIIVEHRFFGESAPDSLDWRFLNITQAAADHHRIVEIFKALYPGKWINSGWSKGGQTAMYHRCFYPEDVDVTVAYDSPLNLALEDQRINRFFDTVGTRKQRRQLIDFQRLVLERKDEMLPLLRDWAWKNGETFSVGLEKALEYAVLEYTFSFWQYHMIDPATVPRAGASAEEIFDHLKKIVYLGSYADRSMNSPSMYQFATELGYYGYEKKYVADLLSGDFYPNWAYAPQNTGLTYSPERMHAINDWIRREGDRMLFLYGDNDPWSAPQVMLTGDTDALKMVLKGGNHYVGITSFRDGQLQEILTTLERWLEMTIPFEDE
ncbi:peptidase [bacterium]|nr:peptidase [bacterium]